MQRLPGAIFQQDNARPHMARVSQDCFRTVTTLPWPALVLIFVSNRAYLESFETVSWASHEFERTRGKVDSKYGTKCLKTPYRICVPSVPDRIASCIRARGGSIGS
ncbi:uncharacterized protein TNCV_3453811 [Trichonephila clavipes]|nr:uncharacterized protein TNCV_3453811 [Trichonephila clavipes]